MVAQKPSEILEEAGTSPTDFISEVDIDNISLSNF